MATMGEENDPTDESAEMPAPSVAECEVSQDPPRSLSLPPVGGFTADDLDRIPDLPPHTELIDGGLVPVTPQRNFHTLVLSMLEQRLYDQLPNTCGSAVR